MTITDGQRNELYQASEKTMGKGAADTLMALLPPVGWADVATKRDLDHQFALLRADLSHMATKADLERGLKDQTRTMLFGLAGINLSFVGAALAGAQLFGA